jgi:hypothetical protein
LDEGQTDLPKTPTYVHVGRYKLVDNLTDNDLIQRFEKSSSKIELLPMWKIGRMTIEKSLEQVKQISFLKYSC